MALTFIVMELYGWNRRPLELDGKGDAVEFPVIGYDHGDTGPQGDDAHDRSEEHTSELQSP